MYTLRLTNTETLEMTDNYYCDFDIVTILFNDRLNVLVTACFEKFKLELLDEEGACLAYADGDMNGGLLWKIDVDDEEWGDWDWALLEEWAENGISAPIPKPDWDTYFAELLEDFGIDEEDIEEWEDDEEDFDLLDDFSYEGNCHCDTYGVCGGISCPYYFTCNNK